MQRSIVIYAKVQTRKENLMIIGKDNKQISLTLQMLHRGLRGGFSTYMYKEVNFDNQQTYQFNTLGPFCLHQCQYSQKEGISTDSSRDDKQIYQLDTSGSSSLQLGQHSGDERISKNHERVYRVLKHYNNANQRMPVTYVKLYIYQKQ